MVAKPGTSLRTSPSATPAPGPRDRLWVLGGIGVAVAAALGLYVVIGAPGLPDQAYERRVDQWATELDTLLSGWKA